MTILHLHFPLVAHAIRIMMTSACLIALIYWALMASTEFTQNLMHQTAYKNALLHLNAKKNQGTKSHTLPVYMRAWGVHTPDL